MPNDFTARSWPAACPLSLSLSLSLTHSLTAQTAPYTLIYARTSCQNVFCCPRLQRFQFALTSRPGSQTQLPACQSVWSGPSWPACAHYCGSPSPSFCLLLLLWANPFVVVRRQADGARIRCCHCHGLPLRHAILLIWFCSLCLWAWHLHNFACEIPLGWHFVLHVIIVVVLVLVVFIFGEFAR